MGGPDAVVEADGTWVIGKRKNGLGRMRSKVHVYVITENGVENLIYCAFKYTREQFKFISLCR